MRKHNLAFIDLETTGLDPERHEIIELGCLVLRQPDLKSLAEIDLKIRPTHLETAEPEALAINGYSSGDWLFAVELESALKQLSEKASGAIMVAHNITFDWPFLERAFVLTGVKNTLASPRLDLLSMAFIKLYRQERLQRFNLRALADYFGLKNEQQHTALNDIKISVEIYKKLQQT